MHPYPRCQVCGKEFSSDVSSCPNCGAALDDAATWRFEPAKSAPAVSYDSIDQARFVPGTILSERYRIVGLLGKGGMGEVYRADDLKLGQPVALKFLPETLQADGAALARFHREVRVARQVSHKNVCRVYDIGEVNGNHFLMFLSKYVALHRIIPFTKPPDVLKEQATQLAKSLGYAEPADTAHTFNPDINYYRYLAEQSDSIDPWDVLRHSSPSLIRFWYRQSPTALLPFSAHYVNMWDPPNQLPGMVRISLSTEGQLHYLDAVPEQFSSSRPQAAGESTLQAEPGMPNSQFDVLFRAAGLDINKFDTVQSQWTPPHAYELRQAWTGVYPDVPQVPIRIEAALYAGKPVYFEIVSPWSKPFPELSDSQSTPQRVGTWILLALFFGTMLIGALLALRNLRVGRGDRRGAFRVALFLFLLRMVHWLFSAHHVAAAEELVLLTTGLQSALFWSCFGGILYLALEPYLRRRWPERIISWNRLLAGDFRDPLVGRDILIGAVFGASAALLMYLRIALPRLFGANPGMPDISDGYESSMVGIGAFTRLFIDQISVSVMQAFMLVLLLLFLSLLLRKDWLGIVLGFVILSTLFTSIAIGRNPVTGLLFIPLANALFVICAVRFGPLALMACLTFFHLWVFFPITTEFRAWYATIFVIDLLFLLAIAVYGFYTSLGGRSPFSIRLLAED